MAYISKITPLGSNTAYDIKAKLVHHTDFLDTSNWQQTITYHKATDYTATYPPGYGYHNTGDTNGAFTIIPYETNTQPWGGTEGLYIGKTAFKWENNTILHSGNYTTYLNDVYVKKSGDTMTGSLTVSSTSPHLYLKNTSWTKGTNPTANSYSAVEFTANNGTGNKNRISLLETTVSTSGNSLLNIYLVPNVEDSTSWSGIVLSKTPANVLSISLQGATTVTGNVNPSADNTYTLGTSGVKWKNVYATTFTGDLSGNASSASTVSLTETTPASGSPTSYYLTYATGRSGNQTLRANADLYYYDTGTTSYLNVGSSSNSGGLTLHNANGKLGNIVSSAFTENRTFTLPDKTGTIALTSDLVDTKVTQTAVTASGYTNWRTLIWGASNSGTEGFTPTSVTDQVYSTDLLTVQPSTGTIRAKNFKAISGNFTANNTGYGLYLKDSAGTSYAGIYDNGANLWVGASSSEGNHHKGSTFISTGYSSNGTTGNLTAYISIPTKSGTTVTQTARAIAHVVTAGSATKPVYADSNGALKPITSYEGNAASATKVYITANSATSGSSYYPTFTTASTSGNQDLKNDTRFYIYDAASSGTYLNIGNSTNSGFLRLWNSNGKNAKIETSAFTDNRTFTLPDKTGTIALISDSAPAINGVYYGVCSTEQATKAKTVTLTNGTNFSLATGCLVAIKFTNASAAATMTLNVNNTGAKNLYLYGTTTMSSGTTTNGWRAGAIVLFVYDGTSGQEGWRRIFWENSTYWNESIYVSTAADNAAKVGNGTYTLEAGKFFQVLITNANTAPSALTLNINNKGAKPIYINGTASSSSNYTLPQGYYLVHYDGTNYYFRTDTYMTGSITGTASNVRGTVAIANGGTGKTTAAEAWTALGGGSVGKLNYGSGTTTYLRNDGTWAAPASDHKVTQGAAITTAGAYPIILATSTATTAQTNTVNKTSTLTYNPSTTKLHTPILEVTTASYGETLPSSGTAGQLFFQTSSGGMYELPTGGTTGQVLVKNSANDRDVTWGNPANTTTAVNATNAYTSASTAKAYIVGATTNAASFKALVHNASVYSEGTVLFGAAWNDYAEFRKNNQNEIQEPGRCVAEQGDGALALTTQRLQRGCEIISDTFGFAIGQDEENGYNTPIAVSGRVLAYIYEGREAAIKHIGWPVCSGPNGTVSIMTEEEEEKYPSRIIGTISEIPNYEYWGAKSIAVKERVWVRIK